MYRPIGAERGLMRFTYLRDGTPVPLFEPGGFVPLVPDEPGPDETAFAGEWGQVLRNGGAQGLDVRLAGHCRPRTTDIADVTGPPARLALPCDRRGLPLDLQRDRRHHPLRG